MLAKVKYVLSLLGPTAVLGILLSSLVLKKLGSAPLLVVLVSFWTETLRLMYAFKETN